MLCCTCIIASFLGCLCCSLSLPISLSRSLVHSYALPLFSFAPFFSLSISDPCSLFILFPGRFFSRPVFPILIVFHFHFIIFCSSVSCLRPSLAGSYFPSTSLLSHCLSPYPIKPPLSTSLFLYPALYFSIPLSFSPSLSLSYSLCLISLSHLFQPQISDALVVGGSGPISGLRLPHQSRVPDLGHVECVAKHLPNLDFGWCVVHEQVHELNNVSVAFYLIGFSPDS